MHQNRRQANKAKLSLIANIYLTCFTLCYLSGAPGEIRTPDLLIRSQSLYPAELRAHTTRLQVEAGEPLSEYQGQSGGARPERRREARAAARGQSGGARLDQLCNRSTASAVGLRQVRARRGSAAPQQY